MIDSPEWQMISNDQRFTDIIFNSFILSVFVDLVSISYLYLFKVQFRYLYPIRIHLKKRWYVPVHLQV